MPSQQEVLAAIANLGGLATYTDLREYFGISHFKGNSTLPQRLKALERHGYICKVRGERKTFFVLLEDFLHGESKPIKITKEMVEKVNNALFAEKQTLEEIVERTGLEKRVCRVILEFLEKKGVVRQLEDGSWTVF